jgi:hypothetical protein
MGHAYGNLCLNCKEYFNGQSRAVLDAAKTITNTPW